MHGQNRPQAVTSRKCPRLSVRMAKLRKIVRRNNLHWSARYPSGGSAFRYTAGRLRARDCLDSSLNTRAAITGVALIIASVVAFTLRPGGYFLIAGQRVSVTSGLLVLPLSCLIVSGALRIWRKPSAGAFRSCNPGYSSGKPGEHIRPSRPTCGRHGGSTIEFA